MAAVLLFIVLALSPSGATRIYQWPWSLMTSLLALAPIALLFLHRFGKSTRLGADAELLFALLAATLVISAMFSRFAAQSLEVCLIALGMLATVFCAAAYVTSGSSDEKTHCLQRWIGWFGIAFCLVSLAGWYLGDVAAHARRVSSVNSLAGEEILAFNLFDVRNQTPLGHSNYTAGLALLLLPWMVGLSIGEHGRKRVLWLGASALAGFVLFTSGSRGALIGVAAIVAALLALASLRGSIRPRTLIGLVAVAGIGLGIATFSQPRVRTLIQDWNQTGQLNSGDEQRWNMVKAGWLMGSAHPIIGQGPGVTPLTYPLYRSRLEGGVESALQLHSLPVQIWADLGLIGIVLTAGIGLVALRRLSKVFRKGWAGGLQTANEKLLASAATSTAGYLAFSLTDFQLDVPVFAALLAINLGVIFGVTRMEPRVSIGGDRLLLRNRHHLALIASIGILIPVLWTSVHATISRHAFSSAVDRLERGDTGGYVEDVSAAMRWSPGNAFYPTSAAIGLLRFAYRGGSPETVAALKAEAADFLGQSLDLDDDQEIAHFNRGWLLLPTDPVAAEHHFRRAAKLVPDKGGVYLGCGLADFEQGDRDAALTGFALEIVNDPRFATAPFWDIPSFAPLRLPAIERAAGMLDNSATNSGTIEARIRSIMHETATLLRDLATEGSPGPLLSSRSANALMFAGMDDASRGPAIEDYLVKRRQTPIPIETVDAYAALFDRTGPDAKAILNDPGGKEEPLLRQTRRERPGYGILMRNLDVPLPVDAYVVQENAVVGDFFPGLFQAKGYLPATTLVRMVSENGGTSE
ncbi:MAG: O-antigen ligase family protein [Opitutaceae bacterium]